MPTDDPNVVRQAERVVSQSREIKVKELMATLKAQATDRLTSPVRVDDPVRYVLGRLWQRLLVRPLIGRETFSVLYCQAAKNPTPQPQTPPGQSSTGNPGS